MCQVAGLSDRVSTFTRVGRCLLAAFLLAGCGPEANGSTQPPTTRNGTGQPVTTASPPESVAPTTTSAPEPVLVRPSLADAQWTVVPEAETSLLEWASVSVLVATELRSVAAGRLEDGFGRLLLAEPIDSSDPPTTAFNNGDYGNTAVLAGAASGQDVYIVGCSDLGGTVWHSASADAEWTTTAVYSDIEANECGVDISIADGLFVVAGQTLLGEHSGSSVWLSSNGERWTAQTLDTEGGFDALTTSVIASGNTIVVGGSVSNGIGRMQDSFEDGTWDKPTVWVSTDRGNAWRQIELLPSGDVRGRVRDLVVLDGQFVAIGLVENVADWLEITDTDVAVWVSKDGLEWTETALVEPGQQVPMLTFIEDGQLYVVGRSRPARIEGVDPVYSIAIWSYKDGNLVLEHAQAIGDLGVFLMTAIAPLDSRWIVSGLSVDRAEAFLIEGSPPAE